MHSDSTTRGSLPTNASSDSADTFWTPQSPLSYVAFRGCTVLSGRESRFSCVPLFLSSAACRVVLRSPACLFTAITSGVQIFHGLQSFRPPRDEPNGCAEPERHSGWIGWRNWKRVFAVLRGAILMPLPFLLSLLSQSATPHVTEASPSGGGFRRGAHYTPPISKKKRGV